MRIKINRNTKRYVMRSIDPTFSRHGRTCPPSRMFPTWVFRSTQLAKSSCYASTSSCYKFNKDVDTRDKREHDAEYDEALAGTSAAM
jgi:hypothetical protein